MKIETYKMATSIQDKLSMINQNLRNIDGVLGILKDKEKGITRIEISGIELHSGIMGLPTADHRISDLPATDKLIEYLEALKKELQAQARPLQKEFERL